MKSKDLQLLASAIAPLINGQIVKMVKPLLDEVVALKAEVAELRAREPLKGDKGDNVDPEVVKTMIIDLLPAPIEPPPPVDVPAIILEARNHFSEVVGGIAIELKSVAELVDNLCKKEEPDIPAMIQSAVDGPINEMKARGDNIISRLVAVEDRFFAVETQSATLTEWAKTAPTLSDIPELITEALATVPIYDDTGLQKRMNKAEDRIVAMSEAINAIEPAPILPDIPAMIKEVVDALPPAEPGKSVTVDELRPVIEEVVGKSVHHQVTTVFAGIPVAKDGRGIAELLIDRNGHLVVTMTDGSTKDVGMIIGKDVDMDRVKSMIIEEVGKTPLPKDGEDGLGFDDFSIEYDGERSLKFILAREDRRKEWAFRLNHQINRGVFDDEKSYTLGDIVTYGGSMWHCNVEQTSARPETNSDWRLVVKKGRDFTKPVRTT